MQMLDACTVGSTEDGADIVQAADVVEEDFDLMGWGCGGYGRFPMHYLRQRKRCCAALAHWTDNPFPNHRRVAKTAGVIFTLSHLIS